MSHASQVHFVRPGLVLFWGSGFALPAPAPPNEPVPTLLLTFVVSSEAMRRDDRMLLLRPSHVDTLASEMSLTSSVPATLAVPAFHATLALGESEIEVLLADETTPGVAVLREFTLSAGAAPLTIPLTAPARLAVESIRRCPFVGACRTMALAARSHDLLLEFLTALGTVATPAPARLPALTLSMTEQLQAAAALLRDNLENPPSLATLAREVGLSETTLKRGFHQVFDTTVFGYLRARRMERARTLLESGATTVLEAAALVGYSNPSNFASAFRRQFGVNPKEFQLSARR